MAINVTSSGTPEQKLEWAFRMYDIDGNGTIDEKEMIKIIEVSTFNSYHIFQVCEVSSFQSKNLFFKNMPKLINLFFYSFSEFILLVKECLYRLCLTYVMFKQASF